MIYISNVILNLNSHCYASLFTLNGVCFETARQNKIMKIATAVRLDLFIKISLKNSVVFYLTKSKYISYSSLCVFF